jgi:hypothetical protein
MFGSNHFEEVQSGNMKRTTFRPNHFIPEPSLLKLPQGLVKELLTPFGEQFGR